MYHSLALQLGALGSPPVVLGVLLVLAAIIVVGRILLSLAWRLVVVAIVVVGALYLLSLVGVSVGVF